MTRWGKLNQSKKQIFDEREVIAIFVIFGNGNGNLIHVVFVVDLNIMVFIFIASLYLR